MTRVLITTFVLLALAACADKAKPGYDRCLATKRSDLDSAISGCVASVAADPNSESGQAASRLLTELKAELVERKAAEAKLEAEKRAAQEAADAKCSKWATICSLGMFPDGSERTTGIQYFPTKKACFGAGKDSGLRCDPCKCWDTL